MPAATSKTASPARPDENSSGKTEVKEEPIKPLVFCPLPIKISLLMICFFQLSIKIKEEKLDLDKPRDPATEIKKERVDVNDRSDRGDRKRPAERASRRNRHRSPSPASRRSRSRSRSWDGRRRSRSRERARRGRDRKASPRRREVSRDRRHVSFILIRHVGKFSRNF